MDSNKYPGKHDDNIDLRDRPSFGLDWFGDLSWRLLFWLIISTGAGLLLAELASLLEQALYEVMK